MPTPAKGLTKARERKTPSPGTQNTETGRERKTLGHRKHQNGNKKHPTRKTGGLKKEVRLKHATPHEQSH